MSSTPTMPTEAELRATFEAAGQSHVFAHWDACDEAERASLLQQLGAIGDLDRVSSVFRRSMADHASGESSKGDIEPVKADAVAGDQDHSTGWRAAGLRAAREGKLAVILLAGGQGTRLGSADPKGMYDVGLPSGRTLFRMQAERLLKLGREAAKAGAPDDETAKTIPPARIPWYIMTSPFTHDATKAHFEANAYFGLNSEDVTFFQQGWLPCFTEEGKIIMRTKCDVATAPDGNGGLYKALHEEGCLADMRRRGVEHVHAYCVDNALVKVGDPEYVGFCLERGVDAGAKVISKAYPEEPVGVFTRRGGKVHVVEYSELPADLATAEDPDTGELRLDAANIVLHYYTLDFLTKCCEPDGGVQASLVYHVARKKVPAVSPDGATTETPAKPNGVKLEAFIFDVYQYAEKVAFLRGDRREDFAPVKNAEGTGKDSPDTARAAVSALHRGWIESAGGRVAGEGLVEVAPAASYAGEGLEDICAGHTFAAGECVEEHAWVLARDKRRAAADAAGEKPAKKIAAN